MIRKSYRKGWSIPGGLLDRGETWEQAAVRETFEEVGIRLNEADLVFIAVVPGSLGPRDQAHLFEVVVDDPMDIKVDGLEIVKAEFVAPKEALSRNLIEYVAEYLRTRTK